ncbi:major facilitator superfamily domain-containing protein [Leucosporidium creatinivorum]|uniref:Major facilitator superfamily domain-containing protein n=1 Tax=Leucosporidium creatinivorum TaxID=106004 RepID=A0A1Y2FWT1_9BASI|nr:major facilitator superfamily domain-containing protein [Leucosporidium creatinivorum]
MPILILLFILNILDRSNIGNAKIAGMSKDLNLQGVDYNNLVTFTFLGYVVTQLPLGFFIAKVSPAVYLSVAAGSWGVVSMCCGFAHTYAAMSGLRFLVGCTEAPFFPGALLILSSYYTRKELPLRIASMYAANSLSNGFGGLLAAAIISGMEGAGGLAGWRWLFIIEGVVTVAIAFGCFFLLPSLPAKTKWLSAEERRLAVWRIAQDTAGDVDDADEVSKWQAVKMVLKDFKILLLILQQTCIACAQSFTYFFPTIVGSLGFSTTGTQLLTAPPYFFAFICSIFAAWSSSRLNEKALHIGIPMVFCAVGNILAITLPFDNIAGRYASMFLMCLGSYVAFNLSWAWISASVPRPRAKRSGAFFLVNALASASHFFTPYMFPSADGPRFLPGGIALAVFCIATASVAITLRFVLRRQNKRLDLLDEQEAPYYGGLEGLPRGYRFIY